MEQLIDTIAQKDKPAKKTVLNVFACKCPRCREGDMFVNKNPYVLKETMKMHQLCPVCGQPLNIEVGFYFGSSYISYALTVAISVATFIAWWVLVGLSSDDNRIFYWLALNSLLLLLLQPYLMRLARAGWLSFFVRYNRYWRTTPVKNYERVNEAMENNW
ncbi:DUF983 domain-containing protein [Ferruginibacter sp.]